MGFGDITPRSDVARLVVTVQMLADLAVIAVVIRMIFGAVTRGVARRGQPDEPTLPTETANSKELPRSDGIGGHRRSPNSSTHSWGTVEGISGRDRRRTRGTTQKMTQAAAP